ncbi:hypothetical protein BpHYR1_050521 [Brachionus plicatilis]|uniref:Uncharacterized protein n=1 Tax=Brachionus plicatilis TaxID=10195 RepID=A0A3M7P8I3_BRAPC|nr:hypothetical protein BpHYR1_050521 [Brachionus plicatilis]
MTSRYSSLSFIYSSTSSFYLTQFSLMYSSSTISKFKVSNKGLILANFLIPSVLKLLDMSCQWKNKIISA